MTSNNKNTPPMPLMQPGAGKPPELKEQGADGLEGTEQYKAPFQLMGTEPHMLKSLIEIEEE